METSKVTVDTKWNNWIKILKDKQKLGQAALDNLWLLYEACH